MDIDYKRKQIERGLESLGLSHRKAREVLHWMNLNAVVIKGQCLGATHPHLANYFTVESLIEVKE